MTDHRYSGLRSSRAKQRGRPGARHPRPAGRRELPRRTQAIRTVARSRLASPFVTRRRRHQSLEDDALRRPGEDAVQRRELRQRLVLADHALHRLRGRGHLLHRRSRARHELHDEVRRSLDRYRQLPESGEHHRPARPATTRPIRSAPISTSRPTRTIRTASSRSCRLETDAGRRDDVPDYVRQDPRRADQARTGRRPGAAHHRPESVSQRRRISGTPTTSIGCTWPASP